MKNYLLYSRTSLLDHRNEIYGPDLPRETTLMGFQKIQIGPLAILGPRVSSRSPGAPEDKKWQFWLRIAKR